MEIKITLKITGTMNFANVYNLKNYNFFYYYTLGDKNLLADFLLKVFTIMESK